MERPAVLRLGVPDAPTDSADKLVGVSHVLVDLRDQLGGALYGFL